MIAIAVIGLMSGGCYYDVEEILYPNTCNTDAVTYSITVLPIIQRECYTCHDALTQNGGVNLEGYDQIFVWIANGKLLSAIKHEGALPMPQDRMKLDSCTIAKIETWIDNGALDN
ncbi:MAG TPA: hypothetical protein VI603_00845 [Saprospiraceae bacterium]|nr:hypothetical protein [Saprospiraceae bacterium]